jgi:DNA primase
VSGIDFHRLRVEITMERVLNLLCFQSVTRSGDQLHGPCPVHRSTSPHARTFSVNLRSQRYYCHKCRSHGNQLELWAAVQQQPFYHAMIDLCHTLGLSIPWKTP